MLSMVDNINNKSTPYAYRYSYFQKYLLYANNINAKDIKNNSRFDNYNLYPKYFKSSKIIKTKNLFNNIDLTKNDLFIKGTSINNLKNASANSSPISKSSGINTINVLDILLPSLDQKFNFSGKIKSEEVEKPPLKLELTKEEKEFDFEVLDFKINNIDDLIVLGKKYDEEYKPRKKRFNLNLRVLADMVESLEELSAMIGMEKIKSVIFDKIILFLQGLDNKNQDYQHIAIYGGPGMGKTHVSKLIGKIYAKMGILSKGDFKEIKLTDLKSGYVGQSELKTQKLLDDAQGCVLFFDEAYSLGSEDKIDSYSQSILDLINLYLDKYKNDFILIIAGYKEDLNNRFFRGNQGLKSRFGLFLELDEYTGNELKEIFIKNVKDYSWNIKEDDIKSALFEENKTCFKYFGRDIANLFSKCKIAHAKRILNSHSSERKIITKEDLQNGFDIYKAELDIDNFDSDAYFNKEIKYSMYS